MKKLALDNFVANVNCIHSGLEVDFYKSLIDAMFEYICGALFRNMRHSDIWYDGTGDLALKSSGDGRLTFVGNMHVAQGQKNIGERNLKQ